MRPRIKWFGGAAVIFVLIGGNAVAVPGATSGGNEESLTGSTGDLQSMPACMRPPVAPSLRPRLVTLGPGQFLSTSAVTDTNSVLAYDGETGAFQRTFASGGGLTEPEGIAFGPDGNLYVSSRSDEVLRYDGKTGEFIDVFASGNGLVDPAGIAFGGPDNDLFVSSGIPDDGRRQPDPPLRRRHRRLRGRCRSANAAGLDDPEGMTFGRGWPALCRQHSGRSTRRGPSLRPSDEHVRRQVRPRSEQQHPGSDRPGLRPRRRPVRQQRRDERGQALRRHDRRL